MRKPYQHRLSECFPIYKITREIRETKEMHVVIENSQGPRTIPSLLQESSFLCAHRVAFNFAIPKEENCSLFYLDQNKNCAIKDISCITSP